MVLFFKKNNCFALRKIWYIFFIINSVNISCSQISKITQTNNKTRPVIQEVNVKEIHTGEKIIAIVHATIIDGNGGNPVLDGTVIIKGGKIEQVGITKIVPVPKDAEIVDAKGMSLLPGFIDSHFHLDGVKDLTAMFLQHGITSLRDPGAWIEAYNEERQSGKMIPRLFLCGPHLDMYPPAYSDDSYVVRDSLEAVTAVNRQIDDGATAIKVYFRLSPGLIQQVCKAAHSRGVPVTAHLEITEAMEAIEAGLDGIEHITSFGLSLQSKREGEKYRQLVLADNEARQQGRYDVWKNIDINSAKADSVCKFLIRKGTFVTPTLGAFEYQAGNGKVDSIKLTAFNNMKAFTGKLKKAGVHIVLGSHATIPYAETGWAFQREMELLVESGLSNSEVIVAATMENARFFRIDDRLGSIEKGKIADMVLVNGNPLVDIKAARNIVRVMLNGVWVSSKL